MNNEVAFTMTAPDRELTIEYGGRTFDLTAYHVDIGVWECTVYEVGKEEPAVPASEWGAPGVYRDPFTALSITVDAIIRRVDRSGRPVAA